MRAPHQRSPQVTDQCPGREVRQHDAGDDAPLGSAPRHHLQIDESDETHGFVAGLDADALAKDEHGLRFGHAERSVSVFGHVAPSFAAAGCCRGAAITEFAFIAFPKGWN